MQNSKLQFKIKKLIPKLRIYHLFPPQRDPASGGTLIINHFEKGPARHCSCPTYFENQCEQDAKASAGGQALITLLFFVLISLTITSAAIIIIIVNSTSVSKLEEGARAYYTAESGVENTLLRLLRDPNYTGETLTIGPGTATITVSGINPKTVVSVGQNGDFKRTVQAQMTYGSGYYTFSNWKEL